MKERRRERGNVREGCEVKSCDIVLVLMEDWVTVLSLQYKTLVTKCSVVCRVTLSWCIQVIIRVR